MARKSFPLPVPPVHSYQELLFRYASLLIKNRLVAVMIVDDVLFQYKEQEMDVTQEKLRKHLHHGVRRCCEQWMRTKSRTLFLRKPKNPT